MRPHPWDSPGKNTGVGCHFLLQCIKVKSECEVAQSCPTLRDLMDCSLPGSSVHGIFQARVLEWGAIAFSNKDILGVSFLIHLHLRRYRLTSPAPCLFLSSEGHSFLLFVKSMPVPRASAATFPWMESWGLRKSSSPSHPKQPLPCLDLGFSSLTCLPRFGK